MSVEFGVLPSADGSARFSCGGTVAVAAVYGPREASRAEASHDRCALRAEVLTAAFASADRRRAPRRDRRAAEASKALTEALSGAVLTELLPRSELAVAVSVLRADGSVRAAALNAALLALADAGVPLRDAAAAASAGLLDGTPCADLTHAEEGKGPQLTLALLPASGRVLMALHEQARVAVPGFEQLLETATAAANAQAAFMRDQMLTRTRQLAASRALDAL